MHTLIYQRSCEPQASPKPQTFDVSDQPANDTLLPWQQNASRHGEILLPKQQNLKSWGECLSCGYGKGS